MTEQNISIQHLDNNKSAEWDAYVQNHTEGTFFHLHGWKAVVEKSYGHKMYYIHALQNGKIAGVLPLGNIKSFLFGNSLTSVPFCVYGGVIADNEKIASALEDEAIILAKKLGVQFLELKNMTRQRDGMLTKDLYVTFRKKIDADADVNMKNIPRKQRAMVRKGIKASMSPVWDNNLDVFYDIYAASVKAHGTPVFPKKYFRNLMNNFGDKCRILNVYKDNAPVSSVMSFYFRDEVLPYYAGGTPLARRLKAFDFMYWTLMEKSREEGITIFDFGRSKEGTGSYSFKKNWGFLPKTLSYQYELISIKNIPEINPLNPKYQLFIKAWQRMPLFMTKIVGPLISKNLG